MTAVDKSERLLPDSVDWPEETEQWFEEWRDSPATDGWTDQQWSYLYDTAWLHAQLWGDGNTTVLSELHRRESYMGLSFEAPKQPETKKKEGFSVIEIAMRDRQKRAAAAG